MCNSKTGSDSTGRASMEDELQGLNMGRKGTHDPFILRLPTELASHILLFCLELRTTERMLSYRSEYWFDRRSNGSTPSELASVCRGWRAIALSTPHLWCHIRVSLRSCCSPYQKFLEDLLSRSSSRPLSFILADEELLPHETSADPVINLLNQHSARWNSVHLFLTPFQMSKIKGNANSFSELVIRSPPVHPSSGEPISYLFAGEIELGGEFEPSHTSPPAPRCVFVEDGVLPFNCLQISWANAAIITLGAISITEFFELLSSTPQLEELTVFVALNPLGIGSGADSTMVFNSSLKRLDITPIDNDISWLDPARATISDIFGKITLRSLEQLALRNISSGLYPLSAFVSRSSCNLRSLHLISCAGDYAENIAELRKIPSISRLELQDTRIDMDGADDFLRELAHTKVHERTRVRPDTLLPNLRSLEMVVKKSVNWSLVPGIIPSEQQDTISEYRPLMTSSSGYTATLRMKGTFQKTSSTSSKIDRSRM